MTTAIITSILTLLAICGTVALKRKQKKILVAILAVSILVLGLVIFRNQIFELWEHIYRPSSCPVCIEKLGSP